MNESLTDLLKDARQEILALRRRNEVLEAQQMVIEVFRAALFADVRQTQGMAIDIAWKLERTINELHAHPQEAPHDDAPPNESRPERAEVG